MDHKDNRAARFRLWVVIYSYFWGWKPTSRGKGPVVLSAGARISDTVAPPPARRPPEARLPTARRDHSSSASAWVPRAPAPQIGQRSARSPAGMPDAVLPCNDRRGLLHGAVVQVDRFVDADLPAFPPSHDSISGEPRGPTTPRSRWMLLALQRTRSLLADALVTRAASPTAAWASEPRSARSSAC